MNRYKTLILFIIVCQVGFSFEKKYTLNVCKTSLSMVVISKQKQIIEGDTIGYKVFSNKSKELTREGFFIFHNRTTRVIFGSKSLLERFKFDNVCENIDTLNFGNKLFIQALAGHHVKYKKLYSHGKLSEASYYSAKNVYNDKVSMMESCDSVIVYDDSTGLISSKTIFEGKTKMYSISFHNGKVIDFYERKKKNEYELITQIKYYDNGVISEESMDILTDKIKISKRYFRDGVLWSEYITKGNDEIYSYEKK